MAEGTRLVLDYYSAHDHGTMACFAANGATGIARYLVDDPANDPRALTAQEVADAHELGLSVHCFFEMNPTYAAYFTLAQGQHDARSALAHLRMLGAPHGTVVYFAVDAPASRVPVNVLDEYCNGIQDVLDNEDDGLIAPGLYGFEAHVEYARTRFPKFGQHLAQTYGTPQGPLDLWQHEQDAICGVSVDKDDCTVDGWRKEEPVADLPQYAGKSADVTVPPGEVSLLQAIFTYPDGNKRNVQRKIWAHTPGRYIVYIYPPVDPDSDPTENLDATPAIFVVDVTTA